MGIGLPGLSQVASAKEQAVVNGFPSLPIQIGKLKGYILTDGYFAAEGLQPILAPGIAPKLLSEEMRKYHLNEQNMEGPINVLLLEIDNRVILFDTGAGHYFGETAGKLLGNLAGIGLAASDVTDIIISHAHIDHIGGVLNAQGLPNFPNATYHIAAREYDFWFGDKPDFSNSKGDKVGKENIDFARAVLGKIEDRLQRFSYGEPLFKNIVPELAAGHTGGHTVFNITSAGHNLYFTTDLFHSPVLISQPAWGTAWDSDFDAAVASRQEILKKRATDRQAIMGCHLPWPGIGFIDQEAEAYTWKPFNVMRPDRLEL